MWVTYKPNSIKEAHSTLRANLLVKVLSLDKLKPKGIESGWSIGLSDLVATNSLNDTMVSVCET